jgi:hypothetical protein
MFKDNSQPHRLTSRWNNGISHHEILILLNALRYMDRIAGPGEAIWWATVGDDLYGLDYAERWQAVSEIQKTITKYQTRRGIKPNWITVHELIPSLHSNILFQSTPQLADRIHEINLPYMQAEKAMQPVPNVFGVTGYLSKERTSEADGSNVMQTIKQAHSRNGQQLASRQPVTPREIRTFIGDRIALSNKLKKDLIRGKVIDPFKATNWDRKNLVGYTGKDWEIPEKRPETKPIEIGQLDLFPQLLEPPARLRQHVSGILSRSAAMEIEFKRTQARLTQRQLGAMVGLSQPQIANAVRGRFGLSRSATARMQRALAA